MLHDRSAHPAWQKSFDLRSGSDAKPDAVGFYERLRFVHLDAVAGQLGDRPEPLPMLPELGYERGAR